MERVPRIGLRLGRVAAALGLAALLSVPAAAQEMMINQAELVHSLLPSVVNITARAEIGLPTNQMSAAATQQQFEIRVNAGSGFIVEPDGTIATNWHVVDGAFEIFVTFSDGSRARAQVVNAARIVDIAMLKVDVGHPLPAVHWGDSNKVQIGDPVLAIGNPLGVGLSVTGGIISALNRNISDTPYDDFIQTDAAINHGNSGGPLFDLKGEVIGVNTALISTTSASAGLGFAIPANDAHAIIDRLMHYGWLRPGWLGVKIQQVSPDMATALSMVQPAGSIVAWVVKGGPAEAAGMHIGDVILRFGDSVPSDDRALLREIASSPPGLETTFTVRRDGKTFDLPVKLAEWPKMQWELRDAPTKVAEPHWNIPPDLGLQVAPAPADMWSKYAVPADTKAVIVTGIARDAEVARRGIAAGDLILRVADQDVGTAAELQQAIDTARKGSTTFAMFLVLPKTQADKPSQFPGPKWIAVRVRDS